MHIPVLLQESIEALNLKKGETVVDCNLNRAGHSLLVAEKIGETGKLIGIDLDTNALNESSEILATLQNPPHIFLMHSNFRYLKKVLEDTKTEVVDKVLFDLGLSSQEIEISGRGFSFMRDEPLHMTYESLVTEETLTAADILNLWEEETLADIIYGYGDERYARRIASKIVESRKIEKFETTLQLVRVIESAVPANYRNGKIHCATKTFQALRIAVNDEIQATEEGVRQAFDSIRVGGRVAVITFHSIEDRLIKNIFKEFCHDGMGMLVNKKPIDPSREEILKNPRSRSSKLRVIEKIA